MSRQLVSKSKVMYTVDVAGYDDGRGNQRNVGLFR
jgi:hypothetical protein